MYRLNEIAACALIKLFVDRDIVVKRVPHDTKDFVEDFVIDIGKQYDGKTKFDHHQYKGGKSSAGLIWDHIGLQDQYKKISELVEKIDRHDTGESKAGEFEVPAIISAFNSQDVYSPEQDKAFFKAVEFMCQLFSSYKREADEYKKAEKICKESKIFEGIEDVIELKEFIPLWKKFFNGEKTPFIEAVVWWDTAQEKWKVQVTPEKDGSFKATGKMFLADENMDFVHQAGFFAIAKDRQTMINFLKNSRK